MKKFLSLILALVLAFALAGCGSTKTEPSTSPAEPSAAPVELTVFAAASMTEALDKVIELYKAAAPNVTIVPTYDSSGTLMTQISEGAVCDLFISAAQKQMNALDVTQGAEKNPDALDFIDPDTRVNILENKVVLVVPEGNPANITKFADLANAKLIALAPLAAILSTYSNIWGLTLRRLKLPAR